MEHKHKQEHQHLRPLHRRCACHVPEEVCTLSTAGWWGRGKARFHWAGCHNVNWQLQQGWDAEYGTELCHYDNQNTKCPRNIENTNWDYAVVEK